MDQELALQSPPQENTLNEARLIALVLDGVTSEHSRRSYRTGLVGFFAWVRTSGAAPAFTRALVQQYRAAQIAAGTSASTLNLRLSPIRKLAREMSDNGLLDPAVAAAIGRVPASSGAAPGQGTGCLKSRRTPSSTHPTLEHSPASATAPSWPCCSAAACAGRSSCDSTSRTLTSGRADGSSPTWKGKGNRVRTVTVPAAVKARIDQWLEAAGITEGRLFRPVNKADALAGDEIRDEKAVWRLVMRYAKADGAGKAGAARSAKDVRKALQESRWGTGTDPAAARTRIDPDHRAISRN